MSGKPVSIRDVAARAGVSPGTVSNVLSGRKPVNDALAERVRKAADELGYQADRAASQLRSGRARIIAVLVPDLHNPFFTSIVAAVEHRLRDQGYEIIVASSNDDEDVERSRLAAILAWRPAGLVVIPSSDDFPARTLIERAKVPYVISDRLTTAPTADTVSVDNEEAGAIGARHLVDLGHRRILIAASSMGIANMRQRCRGAVGVLQEQGLATEVVETGMSFETASERLSYWLNTHEVPTAILALTNFTTLGVLSAVTERRIAIPEDISVIGFDDYEWMRARVTPLTAISQPVEELGDAIWERLSARIAGDLSPATEVRLGCELRVRASTAPAKDSSEWHGRIGRQADRAGSGKLKGKGKRPSARAGPPAG